MKKYLAIYHDLVDKTKNNAWGEAEMLPSENSLTVQWCVS